MDWLMKQAQRDGDSRQEFGDWIQDNADYLVEEFIKTLDITDVPEDFREEELDEQIRLESYIESLDITDVPDCFCSWIRYG